LEIPRMVDDTAKLIRWRATKVICMKCQKPIKVSGPAGSMKKVSHVICPHCNEPNEVMWPMDTTAKVFK
jgi:DNA-directed RNA polymerase subunit RPC12/RpoP